MATMTETTDEAGRIVEVDLLVRTRAWSKFICWTDTTPLQK